MKKHSIIMGSVLLLSVLWSCSEMPEEYSNYPDTLSVSEASIPENTPVYKRTEYIYKDGSRSLNSEEICDEHDNVIKSDPIDIGTDGLSYRVCYRYLYDENGNVLKKAVYNNNNEIPSSYSLNTYNANGTLKEQVQYSHSSSDDLKKKRYLCYEYDSSGNIISKTVENNLLHEIEEKYTYTYDDKGNIVTQKRETPAPFFSETHMNYDDNGNVISGVTKTTVPSGTTESDTKNTYDDKGRIIRI